MKRKSNLYNDMLDIKKIISTYDEICKNTKNKKKVYKYESIKVILFSKVINTLEKRDYKVGKYHTFIITDPKKRIIKSQDMYDKLINHLVSKYILIPSLEPCLIDSNVASRINKGTAYGINLYYKYRSICNRKYNKYYLLKIDINKYFASINKEILKEKIRKRIKEKDSLTIINNIIDSNEEGLGIGSLSNQIFAIFYLNDLDHLIKEELKIKYYIRYQDDMLLIHNDKNYLKYCLDIIVKELEKIDLKINKKTKIYKNTENINYIGVRKNKKYSNINRTKKKYKKKNYEYENGLVNLNSLVSSKINYLNRKKGIK